MNYNKQIFEPHNDKYGNLVAIESNKDVPFEVKRVYYIYDVDESVRRGFHSHKNLEQMLICVHGKVKILLKTPEEEKIVVLDNPAKGLYVGFDVWREMYDFEDGAVLMVLASEYYSENDYIRDYETFKKMYEEKYRK